MRIHLTRLRPEVAQAALGLLLFPGVEVSVTKTTATLTGTKDAIIDAARQAFLDSENSYRYPERSPEEAAAFRLLLLVSNHIDTVNAAARKEAVR